MMQDRNSPDSGYLVPGTPTPLPYPVKSYALLSFEMRIWDAGSGFALRQGFSCILHTPCAGFLKTSAWYRVPGPGYLAPGTRDPVPDQRRGPDTEHRGPG